ncbi:DUF368 domain-containing protein [Nocardioides zeae]|uniref:DUF368 domain-containing protein n=1 Tax=Nocardioides imazamoxiresistens TaxID=3231893 RepID=A0ABU3Q1M1_9ACTN|nr:DUF368 domain-containing protein [Nocardioides zeae]MDT9595351.1 DUF368 domain-containing protein [Nocardioides zeae]
MTTTRARTWTHVPLDVLRGFAIGLAELVPGISGGTVALVTGVYERLLASASHLLRAVRRVVPGRERPSAAGELRRVEWSLVVPVLVGMVGAVLLLAGLVEGFVTEQPEHARGLFLGLVAASVVVPVRMMPARGNARSAVVDAVLVVGGAAAAFLLVGLASDRAVTDPPAWAVFLAAAVAICALAVPGLSGSFFLLAVGLYATTLTAVDERDLGYLGIFAAGAATGLALVVPLLVHVLQRHRRTALLVMTGMMLGSLRAMWPWQSSGGAPDDADGAGTLLAPTGPVVGPVLLALLGVLVVTALVVVESRAVRRGVRED